MSELPTGTVTFLFTDIEGSTRLLQALGAGYRDVLERHSAIVRSALRSHDGQEISTEGDSFFAVFRSAVDAVAAAREIQQALASEPLLADHSVRVRMGLHSGEGRLGSDGYVGLDVHRAARIAGAGHGGQVLLSQATRSLVETALPDGVTLRDLGAHRLKDLEQPERLSQLIVHGLPETFPPIRTLETPTHLPPQLTSFIGRAREVGEIAALLATTRLLTLTGPGGTGKTRLALRLAGQQGPDFTDGAAFVDLAPLTDPALIGPTVAHDLGLTDQTDRSIVELLKSYLEPREMLLVLDNFEHLLSGSGIVQELLAVAPRLKVLVTSRSVLDLYGEQEYTVPPLPLPDPSDAADPGQLSGNEAVALFVDRARAAKPGFALTRERAPAVVAVCLRLDGLPLAIELAASRVRLLEPAEILARLERHLPVLGTGGSNVPERQRTLRAAIAWSYDLLRPTEQRLFARLSIFSGGAALEAVDAIVNPGGELGLDTFDGLASLVVHSIVRPIAEAGETRFAILETIREYGSERLDESGSADEIGRRHLAYYRDLAELGEPHFIGSAQSAWLDRFEREHDNVRAALGRAVQTRDAESGLRLAAALWRFWFQRGYLREGRTWLESLLAMEPGTVSVSRAKAQTALGGLSYWLADVDATERAYTEALRLYRGLGDRVAEAQALFDLGFVPVMRKDQAASKQRFEESISVAREVGRRDLVAKSQAALAITAMVAQDPAAALAAFEEALDYFRESDDRFNLADALAGVAQAHRLLGDHQSGRLAYQEALRMFAEARNLPSIGMTLEEISALESSAGRHAVAIRIMGAAAGLRQTTGASAPLTTMRLGDVEAAARREIGDEAVDEAAAEGRRMTLDEVVEYALSLAD